METFPVSSAIRTDERYRALSAIGRLTFIQASAAFDRNWGHTLYNITALVASAFPCEQQQADDGDECAEEWIAEAKRELRRAVEIGLFLVEETPYGRVIAYRQWERYNGHRDKRGAPDEPMGPQIAATREWSKASSGSRGKLAQWAEHYGLSEVVNGSVSGRTIGGLWSDQSPTLAGASPGPGLSESRGGGRGPTTDHTEDRPPPAPPSPTPDESPTTHETPTAEAWPQKAEEPLRRCGAANGKHLRHANLAAIAADHRTTERAVLLALCLDCVQRTDRSPATVLTWKLDASESPSPESLERSELMLGIREAPRPKRVLVASTGQCDACASFGAIDHPQDVPAAPVPCRISGCSGTLRPIVPKAREPDAVGAE